MHVLKKTAVRPVVGAVLILALPAIVAVGDPAAQRTDRHGERVDRLIEQLGDGDYHVRQQAQAELAKLGFDAFDALSAVENHEDLEIAARARYLLRLMRVQWTVPDDPAEVKKCLEKYHLESPDMRLLRIRQLAELADGAGIPALCRLVRFEKSAVLSKCAAIDVLSHQSFEQPPDTELAQTVRKNLAASRRPGARWLDGWLKFAEDPEAALTAWNELVEAEQAVLKRSPEQSQPQIIAALIRQQIDWLSKLKGRKEAAAAMRRLIGLTPPDRGSLLKLGNWLMQREAWELVGEMERRFPSRFARDPLLLYLLAQAYLVQGKEQQGEQAAERALKIQPGNRPEQLLSHLELARYMQQRRGWFRWAEREYRYVIKTGAPGDQYTLIAYSILAEMLHDQAEDLRAAEVLQDLLRLVDAKKLPAEAFTGRGLQETRGRMHFLFANHWHRQGNEAKHRRQLDLALEADPGEIDALIACYRLPDPAPEYRKKILDLIKQAAAKLRAEIAKHPNEATSYNQFAWLIANTEGDYNLALRYSKKSLVLRPEQNGGYYDTLARCYFAKGDYENALRYQTTAAKLEPHSGLIARQLELFRKTISQEKAKQKPSEEEATVSADAKKS